VSYITEFTITDDQLLATDNRGGLHYGGLADSEGVHVVIPKVTFEAHINSSGMVRSIRINKDEAMLE
jgi:hypothetical protein